MEITNRAIISFLKEKEFSAGFIDSLKIKYRSLICPFIDLLDRVQPGDKVGDIGCGNGQFLLLVSEFTQPSYLFGIEIFDRLIINARKLFKGFSKCPSEFMLYDGKNFPEKLQEMDIVFLIDVIHHVPVIQQEGFFKQLSNKLKPGARLIIKDINGASPLVIFNKLHDFIFSREIGHELSLVKTVGILEKNEFSILEQKKRRMYVYPHFTIVAQKK
ncbi:MAG: class I SAM-dependent methyltransferase [Ginsengibacter sp.]